MALQVPKEKEERKALWESLDPEDPMGCLASLVLKARRVTWERREKRDSVALRGKRGSQASLAWMGWMLLANWDPMDYPCLAAGKSDESNLPSMKLCI